MRNYLSRDAVSNLTQISMDSSSFKALLRVDPSSRCAALSLPKDAIAILPFYQTQADLDVLEQEQALAR
jgi:cleavage and polyadenylation specificity factor subunit 1